MESGQEVPRRLWEERRRINKVEFEGPQEERRMMRLVIPRNAAGLQMH